MSLQTVLPEATASPKLRTGIGSPAATTRFLSRWSGPAIRIFVVMMAIFLIGIVAVDWNVWIGAAILQTTDDAYLRADVTPLAAKSPGYVRSVSVRDFQKVTAGDLLLEIVDDDYRAQLEQSQANVETAQAAIENIEQQKIVQQALVQQAEATIEATQADLTRYHLESVRQQKLLDTRVAGT
jgi:membrane fusion protein (multidrug efflux system)